MNWFNKNIATIGETFDKVAGIQAVLVSGSDRITITCVPVRLQPDTINETFSMRKEMQDFFLFTEQLGSVVPKNEDTIITDNGTYQIIGVQVPAARGAGIEKRIAFEFLDSNEKRIRLHTVKIQ